MRNVHQRAIVNPQQVKAGQALKKSPEADSETTNYDSRNVSSETHSYDFSRMPLFAPLFIQRKPDLRKDVYEQEADQQKAFTSVHNALSSPVITLDAPVKEQMGNMLQFNFDSVKVHNNPIAANSAQQLNARAYTTNGHVVFGGGEYQPQHKEGRKLIAHELTHVVQQIQHSAPAKDFIGQPSDSAEIEAGKIADASISAEHINVPKRLTAPPSQLMRAPTELGTSKTTSPVANLDPRKEMIKQVSDESTLMDNAQVIITWVQSKIPPSGASVDPAERIPGALSFGAEELFNDKKVIKKLNPVPKSVDDLRATLDLMIYYNVLTKPTLLTTSAKEPEYLLKKNLQTNQPDLDKFNESRKDIKDFKKTQDKKEKRPDSLDPMVETTVLPKDMAAGAKEETDGEKNAENALNKLTQELDALNSSGTDDEATLKKKMALQAKIVKAKERFRQAQGFHTFASDVTNLLQRLRKKNTKWKAGTYPNHSWGEFSVDIFLSASLVNVPNAGDFSGDFWNHTVVNQFFDDLNSVTEEEDPTTGKFEWRAIYNDVPLATELNKKFGAGRIIQEPNHGPDGHKLHIHLDLRPVKQKLDSKSGYKINQEGRIELNKG